jgi:hypothetical protein
MNGLQLKIIQKAKNNLHKLDDWQKQFIADLDRKPETYELTKLQNRKLNELWGKLE